MSNAINGLGPTNNVLNNNAADLAGADLDLQSELRDELLGGEQVLLSHGIRGHQRFEDGTSAGMHAARHVNEIYAGWQINHSRSHLIAADIMNQVGGADNDGNGVGERQEAVNAFNDAMGDRIFTDAIARGMTQFKFIASLTDQGEVRVRKQAL